MLWLALPILLALSACTSPRPAGAPAGTADDVVAAVDPDTTSQPASTTAEPTTPSVEPSTNPPATPSSTSPVASAAAAPPVEAAPPAPAAVRPPVPRAPRPLAGSIDAYAGLGTWVDVYDWSHYKGSTPTVGPDQIDQMADEGVETLYLQTAKHDTPDAISEPELLLPIIERAHKRGLQVVAWYLPTLEDPANDLNRLLASASLDVDGIAVDIENRKVGDVAERNRRLVDLSTQLRQALPGRAIGAIVLAPVLLEVVNPNYWPGFPYQEIAPSYDVWQIMGYWTDRRTDSGYRDPHRYTDENMRRLRNNLAQPSAPIHPVGGVGGRAADVEPFLRAAVENGAIGGSLYDWRTTRAEAWPGMRKFRRV